jgi:hypothetical protein
MTLTETYGNLFENVKNDTVYAHCIAQDDNYGAGIAPIFVKYFKIKNTLSLALEQSITDNKKGNSGFCIMIDNAANLVTKNYTHGKPTYLSITNALIDLKNQMEEEKYYKLCMPHIGCGLDKLSWGAVRKIIMAVFEDTNIDILIKNK